MPAFGSATAPGYDPWGGRGAAPILNGRPYGHIEMSSTGEIACFGKDLIEAYWASLQSTMNFRLPEPGEGILLGGSTELPELPKIVEYLKPLGYKFFAANNEVKSHLESSGTKIEILDFPVEDKNALRQVFQQNNIKGVFNIAKTRGKTLVDQDYVMRRNAVDFGVPLFMEPKTALLFAQCMNAKLPRAEGIPPEVRTWSNFTGERMM